VSTKAGQLQSISPVTQTPTAAGRTASSLCEPETHIDDDLFGFMRAAGADIRRRTSPVRVSPAIAFFPFQDDRDLGTRLTEEGKQDPTQLMPPFETEVYNNYFRVNILVEVDRIGIFSGDYFGSSDPPADVASDVRRDRCRKLFNAICDLWGGGKQNRFLTDISPKFLVFTGQTAKKPIFLERFQMQEDGTIIKEAIEAVLSENSHIIEQTLIGVASEGFGGVKVGDTFAYAEDGGNIEIHARSISDMFREINNLINTVIS
jgi:CRISPR-associated protein Cst2